MTENNAAAFDKNAFSTLLGSDDAALLSPLFDRALESLTQFVNADNFDYFDYSQLEFDAHKLKTTCTQLGVKRLANVFLSLEHAAARGDAARCDALIRMLKSEFAQIQDSLRRHSELLMREARPSS